MGNSCRWHPSTKSKQIHDLRVSQFSFTINCQHRSCIPMSRTVTVAALQAHYGPDMEANITKTEGLIRKAASAGAQIILPSELFQGIYFCTSQDERWFSHAFPAAEH